MALPPIFSSTHLPPFLLTTHRLLSNSSNFCNRASRRDEATLKIGGHSGFHARARESWQLRRAETEPRALRWLAGPSVCPDVHGPSEVDFWCYRSFRCPPTRRVVTACFTTSHISIMSPAFLDSHTGYPLLEFRIRDPRHPDLQIAHSSVSILRPQTKSKFWRWSYGA